MIRNLCRAVLVCCVWLAGCPARPLPPPPKPPPTTLKLCWFPMAGLRVFWQIWRARIQRANVTNSFAQLDKYLNFAAMAHMEVIYRDTVGLLGNSTMPGWATRPRARALALDGQMSFTMTDLAAFYRLGTLPLAGRAAPPV